MDNAILRILDANLNRAREGLRVLEDHARFVLNDAVAAARIKNARHALTKSAALFGVDALLIARDTPGDVGTAITTPSESVRKGAEGVARAAAARVCEALRCVEEYGKIVSPEAARQVEHLRYDVYSIEQDVLVTAPRRLRFRQARLHVLLTEALCANEWFETARAVLEGGADAIQLREKSLRDVEMLKRAQALRELTHEFGALFIVNDRADIAHLARADAVHLGQDDLSIADARRIGGATLLVGRSAHDRAEIEAALADGADYLGVGPMFATETKPHVTIRGPELLALARRLTCKKGTAGFPPTGGYEVSDASNPPEQSNETCARRATFDGPPQTPIVAIGGITSDNVGRLLADGGDSPTVAVCGNIIGSADPQAATQRLLAAQDSSNRSAIPAS